MAERPIVYIRPSEHGDRPPGRRGRGRQVRVPSTDRQRERISPRIRELEEVFERRTVLLSQSAAGVAPEEVIVFDLATTVEDLVRAVRRIEGMEWLVESDEFDAELDEDFGPGQGTASTYQSRLYFVASNQQAFRQLLGLWRLFQAIESGSQDAWPYGMTRWREVFRHLKDVRRWGPEDRLLDTGLMEDWTDRLSRGDDYFPVEVDLWFRESPTGRERADALVRQSIEESGGQLLSQAVIPEIGYHGMLARLDTGAAEQLLRGNEVALVLSGPVMRLRPAGQFSGPPLGLDDTDLESVTPPPMLGSLGPQPAPPSRALPQGSSRVALLDGMPLVLHEHLDQRVLVYDPDNFEAAYAARDRRHGTAMASIILHGDLSNPGPPLSTPLVVRPIMKPDARTLNRMERVPDDVLAVDLVHRAVRELLAGSDPVAPRVRLINLSVCDPSRPFDHLITPMARLLDWLSWQYNVLFIVSAGNHGENIPLGVSRGEFEGLSESERDSAILAAMWGEARLRRLLSPAESINAITVGSTHEDNSVAAHPRIISFFSGEVFPSPPSALGLGYGRSVKPDVLAPGGRQPYGWSPIPLANGAAQLRALSGDFPPGTRVAGPGEEGQLGATAYSRGTSNAAASVSRLGERILGVLQGGATPVDESYEAVITKCLIAHAAEWGTCAELVAESVAPAGPRRRQRLDTTRFLGFGRVSEERAAVASDQRVTLVGWGELAEDEAELYEIPLPPSLSGVRSPRRLTITLAWLSPTNPADRRYRQAALWFEKVEPTSGRVFSGRREVDHNMVRKGTLQHEIFEGKAASVFVDGEVLRLRINCREDAGGLGAVPVPYGLAISLEVAEELQLPIYDEVVTRIRPTLRIFAQG